MPNRIACFTLFTALLASGCTSALKQATPPTQTSQLTIATSSLPGATVGSAYSGSVAASGGTAPYSFAASGLPNGLSISASTGAITANPKGTGIGLIIPP